MNLVGHAPSERREHLKRYVFACFKDSLLSPMDLKQPTVLADKLLKIVSQDVKALTKDLARGAGDTILRAVGALAGDIVGRKSK
jgi:hypothetical protein